MNIIAPENTPVWINEHRCKVCNICIGYCPAGVSAMRDDIHAVLGQVIEIVHPESCIDCTEYETHCPNFATMVARRDEFKFAKLSPEAREKALAVENNKYKELA